MIKKLRRWWRSLNVKWYSLLTLVGAIQQTQSDWLPWLKVVLETPERVGLALSILGIIGILLRAKTSKPLSER